MRRVVQHTGIVDGAVDARAYQLEAVDEALTGSMLLVLPTAAGKTAVAWMTIAEMLNKNDGWILFIAPTNPLVDQHIRDLKRVMKNINNLNVISMTGSTTPEKRKGLWNSSRIIVATPHVVRNDVINGILDLKNCSHLIIDEAHHSTGNHAMARTAELYNLNANEPLILAMTASPGSKTELVAEICERLKVERIHIRTAKEPMLEEYLAGLEIQEIIVNVPEKIRELVKPLELWINGIVNRQRRLGRYVRPGHPSFGGLKEAQMRAQNAISLGDTRAYSSVSQIATAMTLNHLINHLLTQGITAAREFLDNSNDSNNMSKSLKMFHKDPRILELKQDLDDMDEIHTKVGTVRRLIRHRLRRDQKSKIIVFASFRNTVESLDRALDDLKDVKSIQVIGQSDRAGKKGLKPKQQIEVLDKFREGEYNVLVATSVAEEGLDIPSADLVIFYEPVGSEIRTIQRRGRTGRHREGEVMVLVAEGTKDESAKISAERKEENMQRAVHRIRRKLPRKAHEDLSNMNNFKVKVGGEETTAVDFILRIRKENRPEITKIDENEIIDERRIVKTLEPSNFRPRGQKGLEEFRGKDER